MSLVILISTFLIQWLNNHLHKLVHCLFQWFTIKMHEVYASLSLSHRTAVLIHLWIHQHCFSSFAQSSRYWWVAAYWFPLWCDQLPEPTGSLWRPSASLMGHQAIAGSQHREAHPGYGASFSALRGNRSVGNHFPPRYIWIQSLCLLKNILFLHFFRRKVAASQSTPKSQRKNLGRASN